MISYRKRKITNALHIENSGVPRSEGSIGIVFLSRSNPPREGRTRFCGVASGADPAAAVVVEGGGGVVVALTGVIGAGAAGGAATAVFFDLLDFVVALLGAFNDFLDFFPVGG